jgi:hypothetical protein
MSKSIQVMIGIFTGILSSVLACRSGLYFSHNDFGRAMEPAFILILSLAVLVVSIVLSVKGLRSDKYTKLSRVNLMTVSVLFISMGGYLSFKALL